MIEYKFARVEPLIDKTTNNVIRWVIGMTAKDTDTNVTAYIDTVKDVTDQKPLSQWTADEIRNFCLQAASDNNWYSILADQINSLNNQPVSGQNVQI
jgi:tetrahydromethanopterin S-methyltransferase subunit H